MSPPIQDCRFQIHLEDGLWKKAVPWLQMEGLISSPIFNPAVCDPAASSELSHSQIMLHICPSIQTRMSRPYREGGVQDTEKDVMREATAPGLGHQGPGGQRKGCLCLGSRRPECELTRAPVG